MTSSPLRSPRYLCAVLLFAIVGCASPSSRVLTPATAPDEGLQPAPADANATEAAAPAPAPPEPVVVDATAVIIDKAMEQYNLGEEAYKQGNLDLARKHFDAAVLKFLDSGQDISANPRLKAAFDRVISDIRSLDSEALADSDEPSDFSETPVEEIQDITSFLGPDEAAAERKKVGATPETEEYSIPVELNEQVLTFIDAFENIPRFREAFRGGYQRMGRYEPMIRRILKEEGVPQDLIYLAFIESTFKPHAYSRARAKGMWQFMAPTGKRYGLDRDYYVDERSDFEAATHAAAQYLRDLHEMFGDWYLAMAAYNAGEMKVSRAIARTGKKDFWALSRTRHLRRETKNFVPSILALSIISRDPAKYGHPDLVKDPPLTYDWVTVDGPTEISLVAKLTGSSESEIRELNPKLLRSITPPGVDTFRLRVPAGTGDTFQQAYAKLPDSEKIAEVLARYRVRSGDTLSSIARRHGTTVAAIAQANGLGRRSRIYAGHVLLVPKGGGGWSASAGWADGPVADSSGIYVVRRGDTLSAIAARNGTRVSDLTELNGLSERSILHPGQRLRVSADAGSGASDDGGEEIYYTVRSGDTLSSIARMHGTSVQGLQSLNGLSHRSILHPGDRMRIRPGASAGSAGVVSAQKLTYTVRRGDNLYGIATRYGTTVERLRAWNNMGHRTRIYPGETLDIYRN